MESDDPRLLVPMLFLLLVMSAPLRSIESFQPTIPGWGNLNHHFGEEWEGFNQRSRYHRSQTEPDLTRLCDGKFDLYFLVDASQYARDSWNNINKYVQEMVKKYSKYAWVPSPGRVHRCLQSGAGAGQGHRAQGNGQDTLVPAGLSTVWLLPGCHAMVQGHRLP
uniref:Uncharacterized protein n=1 Tax=Molossus molossus TaxID=27622 RepID=A0A7J8DQR7_MOLMO|nr:hypothetical protein HJG59_009302 [Molossus molossus]